MESKIMHVGTKGSLLPINGTNAKKNNCGAAAMPGYEPKNVLEWIKMGSYANNKIIYRWAPCNLSKKRFFIKKSSLRRSIKTK